jgi:vancomycin aglycone glucosyltransferase
MRALLSTIGSRGDVEPLVALALQLRALGHEARLCVPADFQEWIESLGFPVTPTGPPVRTTAAPDRSRSATETFVTSQFDSIDEAAKDCDVILAATALQVAARTVAERQGIPYVFAAYCPIVFPSPLHAPPALPPVPGETPLPPSAGNAERWARNGARFNDLFSTPIASRLACRPWTICAPTCSPSGCGSLPTRQ